MKRALTVLGFVAMVALVAFGAWLSRNSSSLDPEMNAPATSETPSPSTTAQLPDGSTLPDPTELVQEDQETAPLRRQMVALYFPGRDRFGLVGELHEIFETRSPGDRAKQILADLLAGPFEESSLAAVPQGTTLRQVYVAGSVAYVDVTGELKDHMRGGSGVELLTIYAIVNSIALNLPEIDRVAILVDGKPIETLNGHVDLRRPLAPDRAYITKSVSISTGPAKRPFRG